VSTFAIFLDGTGELEVIWIVDVYFDHVQYIIISLELNISNYDYVLFHSQVGKKRELKGI